jgi:transcriptional regulator with XRE-family HTH domain
LRRFLLALVEIERLICYDFLKTIAGGNFIMTLGEKIQKLRKQRGLSQEALAEKVTVTRQTISKWELGQSTPDLDFIAQLSDIFNVSSDYLIKDEMIEPDELL